LVKFKYHLSTNNQIILKRNPRGIPEVRDFGLINTPIPNIAKNQILTKTIHISLDPYIRGLITGKHIYAEKINIGDVIAGRTIGEVIKSKNDDFNEGEIIVCSNGWQEYAVTNGEGVRKLNPEQAPITTALGILGMPGLTAYAGLLVYGEPKDGDIVVVSAASGPVGSMVGQIAQISGAKALGIAGSMAKCSLVKEEFGFFECINYKTENLDQRIKQLCPNGVDIYFDNVGGQTLETMTNNLAMHARIVLCGFMTQYNSETTPPGPNLAPVVGARATIKGVVVYDHYDKQEQFISLASKWLDEGKIKYKEDEVFGLDQAPILFCRLMRGENFGKAIVTLK